MNSEQTLDILCRTRPRSFDAARRNRAARGLFLTATLLAFGLSVGLFFSGNESEGIFVGLWVPSILALGAFLAPRRAPERGSAHPGAGR
jgi:hypothetical protein